MFCFTSRIARKSDPVHVGRSIFVNVLYEYHYKVMNLINSISRFPQSKSEPSVVAGKTVGVTSTTLLTLFLH